ncbi:MAG: radical SAM protein, partial [Bacteroidia bacterium]
KTLIATDIEYYKRIRNYNKRSEIPLKFNTPTLHGCPYDCGLCPDHEQHSCLTLIEVTDRCNLTCPTCYAESSPTFGNHRTLDEIKRMLDVIVANEGKPDVVQLSGGEPTIHPHFFEILDEAKKRPIKHLMLNTNGIRIAKEEEFVKRLATYMPDFEIYLQWDSFDNKALQKLRGADLLEIRLKAIENLNKYNLSTTLVVTLQRGVNNHEIGKIIEYALKQPCVRGVTFQPTQVAGRNDQFNPTTERYTLTEVRRDILEQTDIFNADDLIPVPCNPDALVMGYALKIAGEVIPLTRYINPADLLDNSKNTIVYEQDERLHTHVMKIFSTANSVDAITGEVNELLCCLPFVKAPNLSYNNLFRIIIMNFIDAYNFDVRAIKKSCVHIVHNDKIIPFETMNLFYRNGKEKKLEELRELKIV